MKELFLLRHAKSSRDGPALSNHDRPLALRGERNARAIGAHMRELGFAPALVLCSSARRAQDTLALIMPFLAPTQETRIERALYLASASVLLRRLRALDDGLPSVMVIGHNPGLAELALLLARKEGPARERRLRADIVAKLPTGALVVLRFPARRWSRLGEGTGRLVALLRPRDLVPEKP